jgi:hypothetical protein
MNCEHCEAVAAEVRETRAIVEHLVAESTATRTVLEGMQKTLLGNGQPGWCAQHCNRIAQLERWRSWVTGALAVISLLWLAVVAIVTTAVQHLKR